MLGNSFLDILSVYENRVVLQHQSTWENRGDVLQSGHDDPKMR